MKTKFIIPEEAYQQHLIVLGKTGAGKSYTLRILIENLLRHGNRVCIIDPKGDHWGIKSSADGKKAGYPVVIFGGDHADVPLNPRIGKEVAELIATGNRPSVIDFRGWMPGERTTFWIDFASTLFRHNRQPLWLIVDEVHNFAPQGKVIDPQAGKSLHWTNRLASEGRGIGIKLFMASQRPQKVHKDTLTCAETLIAMRVIHPLDRNAMKDWIDGIGDKEKGTQVLNSLASMARGEAFVWSPEIGFYEKLKFPLIETYDSFQAPSSSAQIALKGWADVDLKEITTKLESVIDEQKKNDPAELKRKIRELEQQLKKTDNVKLNDRITELEAERDCHKEMYDDLANDIKSLDEIYKEREKRVEEFLKYVLTNVKAILANGAINVPANTITDIDKVKWQKLKDKPKLERGEGYKRADLKGAGKKNLTSLIVDPYVMKDPHFNPHARMRDLDAQFDDEEIKLSGGAKRMVEAVVNFYPGGLTEAQVRAQAGLKKGGHFTNSKSKIKTNGLIEEKNGLWYASEKAMDLYSKNFQKMPMKTDDVIELWKDKLPGKAMEMLGILISDFPRPVNDIAMQEEIGLAPGGHYNNLKSKLRTAELIIAKGKSMIANAETLML